MDISLPKLSGIEATKLIKMQNPNILVLVFTIHNEIDHIFGLFEAGADGYLVKTASSEEIIQGILGLAAEGILLSKGVFKQILMHGIRSPIMKALNKDEVGTLNKRGIDILSLAGHGLSNKEIAYELAISLPTVKNNLVELYSKLGVNSRTGAIVAALKTGIISLE